MKLLKYSRTLLVFAFLLVIAACNQAPLDEPLSTQGVTFTVTSTFDLDDLAPGDGSCLAVDDTCTLRAAIQETNALAGTDTINLPANTYLLVNGVLNITDSLTILGSRDGASIVDGNNNDTVFFIGNQSHKRIRVALHFLTIQHGRAESSYGGGILNEGEDVLINKSIVRENYSIYGGGGIYNSDYQDEDNYSSRGHMEILSSSILNNEVEETDIYNFGGGIGNAYSILRISKSTISGNRGGGIRTHGTLLIIQNSTISGNVAPVRAGGLHHGFGDTYLNNVTIVNNTSYDVNTTSYNGTGGVSTTGSYDSLFIANSIIAGNHSENTDYPDCSGTITSIGYNLIEDTTGCTIAGNETGNIYNADPLLGPLAANGGDTFTHALLAGSPARNAGNPAPANGVGTACEPTDQRFMTRGGLSGRCDMGAYERGGIPGEEAAP